MGCRVERLPFLRGLSRVEVALFRSCTLPPFQAAGNTIFSKTLTESITLTQKWEKNTKIQVIESETGSGKCAVIRSTRNDRSDYSGTTELYRTVSLTVPNSIAILLINFLQDEKKN